MAHDYRYDAFNDVAEPVQCKETHVIPMNSPFVVRLNEVPQKTTPSGISLTIAGTAATEVAAAPASGEFRPDYSTGANNDSEWNTGLIQFNAADAGKVIETTYNGLGTLASVKAPSYPAWFTDRGDGSDGDYAPTASTTLAGGTYNFKSVNIPSGVTITLTGCVEIKCLGAFTCAGIITANGTNGSSSTAGKGCNGYISNNAGGKGGSTGGVGAGAGGAGGHGGSAQGGDHGIDGTPGGGIISSIPGISSATALTNYVLSNKLFSYGGGGGAGGGSYVGGGSCGGGGGGSILIIAHSVNVTGQITADGGKGGNGTWSEYTGGGGGGGGAIVIVADTISNTGTVTANGGLGGASGGGYSGRGVAGANGIVYLKELGAA